MPVFAVAVAVPLSVSVAKLARMSPFAGRYAEPEEPTDPDSIRLSERIAKDQQRRGRLWASELKARLDRPLGDVVEEEGTRPPAALRQGVLAPAMLLLVRRWLNIQ